LIVPVHIFDIFFPTALAPVHIFTIFTTAYQKAPSKPAVHET